MAKDESAAASAASGDSISGLPLEQREKLLEGKLAILNRSFVKFLYDEITKDAEVDLTPCVNSYTENVRQLKKMYGMVSKEEEIRSRKKATGKRRHKEKESKERVVEKSAPPPPVAPAALPAAKTPSTPAAPLFGLNKTSMPSFMASPLQKTSTPASGAVAPQLNMSADISAISASPFASSSKGKTPDADETMKSTQPALPPAAGGRKRAIRGGGPLGDSESIVFRGSDAPAFSALSSLPPSTAPKLDFQLPKATPDFWSKKPPMPPTATTTPEVKEKEKKEEEPKKPASSLFPAIPSSASSSTAPSFATSSPFSIGSKPSLFASFTPAPSTTTAAAAAPPPLFGGFGGLPKPTGSTPLSFSFAPKAPAAPATGGGDGAAGGEEEEGEYVPPKVEVVANEEPDATFSVECLCFKLTDKTFEKLGKGMLHLKGKEGKKSVLVRAGTATGTIWVNALMDTTMKTDKAADDKIRFTVPVSATEVKTFLVRVAKKEDAKKILDEMKAAGAK